MKIEYHKNFEKAYKKKDFFVRDKFKEKLKIFIKDPLNIILNNHSLDGKYIGHRSINVTGDYRAIFKEIGDGKYEFIEFVDIGTHSQLYK